MKYQEQINSNHLRTQRNELNIRQQDVADKLGFCTTDRISHWEKGQAMPNIINLFRLAAIYNIPPHELYPELYKSIVSEIQQS